MIESGWRLMTMFVLDVISAEGHLLYGMSAFLNANSLYKKRSLEAANHDLPMPI